MRSHYGRSRADLLFYALGKSYGNPIGGYEFSFSAEGFAKHPSAFDSTYNGSFKAEQQNANTNTNYLKQMPGAPGTELQTILLRCYWPEMVKRLGGQNNRLRGVFPSIKRFYSLEQLDFGLNLTGFGNLITDFSGLDPWDYPKLRDFKIHGGSTGTIQALNFSRSLGIQNVDAQAVNATSATLGATTGLLTWNSTSNSIPSHDFSLHAGVTAIRTGNGLNVGQTLPASTVGSLTGVAGKIALQTLFCNNNNLNLLTVAGCTSLQDLRCPNNKIADLSSITTISSLQRLHCQNNVLPALNLSTNLQLFDLNCSNNLLPALDVRPHANMTSLQCNNNKIPSLDVSQNAILVTLACATNLLPSLDVSHNPKLQFLHCHVNKITGLDVSMLPDLAHLSAYQNRLDYLILSAPEVPKKLINIALSDQATTNFLQLDISSNTVDLTQLLLQNGRFNLLVLPTLGKSITVFNCSNNPLQTIDNLDQQFFPDAPGAWFICNNSNLNQPFKLGERIRSREILIYNNVLSVANMTASMESFFTWRNSFNNTVNKIFKAAGTNAALPGTLSMPTTGYAGSIHDLSEAAITAAAAGWTTKEKCWVLKNLQVSSGNATLRYKWTTFEIN